MILAGDIGGTNIRLGLFSAEGEHVRLNQLEEFLTRDYCGLERIIESFVAAHGAAVEICCFGVAGPVVGETVRLTNLPWEISPRRASAAVGFPVLLINDLEATAYGIAELGPEDFVTLQEGAGARQGNAAVIAAGTGLGEAGLFWDGRRHIPFACEGGHCDFAPSDRVQLELLQYLRGRDNHVSVERVVSGPGLVGIYSFLLETSPGAEPELPIDLSSEDPAAAISRGALEGKSELCAKALDVFVSCYGAEAGNLALKMLALGGVFVAGGIAPRILPKLQTGVFLDAFNGKGRLSGMMRGIPVKVVVNERTALLGAARYAAGAR